ncbi:TBC1 domain family member 30 isoform X3 [Girardinichthys multiradiatus]|uniref:TBC1 domain family member 30 isoform X3 n=1 Tax=Girardinichthys multiradiatus TaxID=208333 RepID=UPI001FAB37CB|nr:TBC1 domain family member 30 isoform X3 [Girardinichthys multiradiatus]
MQEGTGSSWTGPHLSEVSCGVFQEHSEKLPSHSCSNISSQINNLRIRTGPAARNMASELGPNAEELLEANICDRGVGSEEESGVFIHSTDDFCGFQRWTNNDTSSSSSLGPAEPDFCRDSGPHSRTSIVDCLLVELYDAYGGRRNADSWDSSTEASGSDAFLGRSISGSGFLQELQERHTRRLQMNYLAQKDLQELRSIIQEVKYRSGLQSTKLIRQLKRRDRFHQKRQKNYDIITACLQAVSQKRRVDTRLKFTIEPSLGNNGFQQWYDALKAVARLPTGIPKEWRRKVWLTLADQYLHSISIDWEKTLRFAFNERSNPDDDSLGIQIVKDLHRTGCSSYCGQEGEQDRVVLKRVLLAYARWNKTVGYCQGFNVLAALILEVTEGNESDALKVMIYLIDKVLPDSYFANNLRALSVDMAVFRDLLRVKLPRLSQHLHHLQKAANREAGGSYEPPLTNVFTMQWFLTMFATCLPAPTVLKIWDSVFFEGSEVLFRVALAIWERLGERIEECQTADYFYSTMGCLTQEMLEHDLVNPAELMQDVYSMAVFPFPQLAELREKYTYNITPFSTSVKSKGSSGPGSWDSEDDGDMDNEESVATALGCLGPLGGLLAPELQRYQKHLKDQRVEQGSIAEVSPGAVGAGGGGAKAEHQAAINSMMMERMSTDITALKKQYTRIKRRQQQQAMQLYIRTDKCPATRVLASQLNPSTSVINHLLLARKQRGASRSCRPISASTPSLPGSPSRRRCGSLLSNSPGSPGSSRGSPWRAHVRQHRRNVARVRAQLGFGDSAEREDDDEEEERELVQGRKEEDEAPFHGGSSGCEEAPRDAEETEEVKVEEVVVQLDSLDLESETTQNSFNDPDPEPEVKESKPAALIPPLPPPSSNRHKELDPFSPEAGCAPDSPPPVQNFSHRVPPAEPSTSTSSPSLDPSPSFSPSLTSTPTPDSVSCLPSSSSASGLSSPPPSSLDKAFSPSTPSLCSVSSSRSNISSSSSVPGFLSAASAPKQQIFSPFPLIKQPRKSLAARNLGLYGPTSRTPTVHFPQLSRNLNRSSAAGTTGRR